MAFSEGNFALYLYMTNSEKGEACTALYVNDALIVGNPEAIDEVIEALKKNE